MSDVGDVRLGEDVDDTDPTVPADGFDAVKDRLDLAGTQPGTTRSLITIGHCYDYLAKYGTASEADLPGVSVTQEGGTPDPSDIQIETLQDVLDGLREVGAVDHDVTHDPGREVWRGEG